MRSDLLAACDPLDAERRFAPPLELPPPFQERAPRRRIAPVIAATIALVAGFTLALGAGFTLALLWS